ncbi:MAG TPA: BLUF domain-containing protein [Bryobacteraceae bacterium]|nr:BLUF domain-containing protein [Bryobacteraceae bacterium]
MLSLVYVSSATQLFSEYDLEALLRQSCDNNARLGLTGMLLYKDGNFMQALEGPDDAVLGLYRTIEKDPRHRGILPLMRQQIQDREFPSWSMGFRNLKDVNLQQAPGYGVFLNEPLNSAGFRTDPTRAQKLLGMFREKM